MLNKLFCCSRKVPRDHFHSRAAALAPQEASS